jgi:hypothetical protein
MLCDMHQAQCTVNEAADDCTCLIPAELVDFKPAYLPATVVYPGDPIDRFGTGCGANAVLSAEGDRC